jgi:hypothetical protein
VKLTAILAELEDRLALGTPVDTNRLRYLLRRIKMGAEVAVLPGLNRGEGEDEPGQREKQYLLLTLSCKSYSAGSVGGDRWLRDACLIWHLRQGYHPSRFRG